MTVEIENWKDLKEQFGLTVDSELFSAVEISRSLRVGYPKEMIENVICVPCSKKNDAIAIFRAVSTNENTVTFIYEGTAN